MVVQKKTKTARLYNQQIDPLETRDACVVNINPFDVAWGSAVGLTPFLSPHLSCDYRHSISGYLGVPGSKPNLGFPWQDHQDCKILEWWAFIVLNTRGVYEVVHISPGKYRSLVGIPSDDKHGEFRYSLEVCVRPWHS